MNSGLLRRSLNEHGIEYHLLCLVSSGVIRCFSCLVLEGSSLAGPLGGLDPKDNKPTITKLICTDFIQREKKNIYEKMCFGDAFHTSVTESLIL